MSGAPLIAIFGCAVLAGGRPSPSLARRIRYGREAAGLWPDAQILCSGGLGRHPPSEAAVMRGSLVRSGVAPERLVLDDASLDTFQSAVAAARLAQAGGHGRVIVCSDRYHVPRIRMLMAVLGVQTVAGPALAGTGGAPFGYWAYMTLREAVAIPYDLAVVLARRRALGFAS